MNFGPMPMGRIAGFRPMLLFTIILFTSLVNQLLVRDTDLVIRSGAYLLVALNVLYHANIIAFFVYDCS